MTGSYKGLLLQITICIFGRERSLVVGCLGFETTVARSHILVFGNFKKSHWLKASVIGDRGDVDRVPVL